MKIYKGYELLKAIENGEIRDGTKLEIKGRFQGGLIGSYFVYREGAGVYMIYTPEKQEYEEVKLSDLLNYRFEPIEDIEEIEEIEEFTSTIESYHSKESICQYCNAQTAKINELVRAYNNSLKEREEKVK